MSRFDVAIAVTSLGLIFAPALSAVAQSDAAKTRLVATPWPVQVDMRVPFAPTPFPSGQHIYLMYELHLTNFGTDPLPLHRVEVFDADARGAGPIATFEAAQLATMLQPYGAGQLGIQASENISKDHRQISGGGTAIIFMAIVLDRRAHIPNKLIHRVAIADATVEGAEIGAHNTKLHILGSPLEGASWLASDGPGNDPDNHHRRGLFSVNGRAVISRRYAIDWMQMKKGATFSGNARDMRSYYAYGKPVLAVADGRVITARDGLPDNVPGHNENFHPAIPITMQTVVGNTITLDLGGGQFAYYCHLQPRSLHVKVGDHVRRGQLLARVGDSGDAREPHLHFEITTSPKVLAGEGVPYLIDRYSVETATDGIMGPRTNELPMNNSIVDFGGDRAK